MEDQDIICRFCFENCDGKFNSIETTLEEMLDTLLLKMNPALSEASFICTSCEDAVNRCYQFKSTCLFMQTNIISNLNIDNARANSKGVNPQDRNTCSLCMAVLKSCSFISLDNADQDMLNQVFERCIPELDLTIAMKPAICKACYEHLQIYFNVMRNCSILEKPAMADKGLLSSQDVLKHTSSKDICKENENNVGGIEIEGTFCEDKKNKCNYMEMGDTKSIDVLNFTSENILAGNDGIEVGEIKTEVAFCEKYEDGTKQDGKCVEAPQDMLNCTSIYEVNEIKIEAAIYEEEETEFDDKIYTEMEDTKYFDVLQFTSRNVACNSDGATDGIIMKGSFCEKLTTENEVKSELFFADCELNNVQELSSEHTFKCEEENNENFTETDDEKFLPYNEEQIEIALMDQRNFDSAIRDPLEPVTDEISEKRQYLDLFPHVSETLLSKFDEECKNDFGRPEPITEDLAERALLQEHTSSSLNQKLNSVDSLEEPVLKNMEPPYKYNSKTRRFQCEICPYQAKCKSRIKYHSLVHKDPSEVTMYQCQSCLYQTKHKSSMVKHALLHTNVSNIKIYQCKYCPFQTRYTTAYSKHISNHKRVKSTHTLYQCDFCSFKSTHKRGLACHKEIHKNSMQKEVFRCFFCSFQTIYKRAYTRHSLKHENSSAIRRYQCKSCTFVAKTRSALLSHKLIHKKESKITMYECAACSYQTNNKEALDIHNLIHKDLLTDKNNSITTVYKCEFCSYEARHKYRVDRHSLVHMDPSKVKMLNCESCSYQSKDKRSMVKHSLIHKNPSNIKIYHCDYCPFQTKYKTSLFKHLLGHNGTKSSHDQYQCDFCSFKSKHKSGLVRHKVIHQDPTEMKIFHCDSCSFQTIYKDVFTRHSLKHKDPSAIKMYQCKSCMFKTKTRSALSSHTLIHKKESVIIIYQCAACLYQTRDREALELHNLVHKDLLTAKNNSIITIYQCESCSYQANYKYLVSYHSLVHKDPSEVTMFKCKLCSHQSKYKNAMARHSLTHKKNPSNMIAHIRAQWKQINL